ncbi:MAG: oligosaccharide flippase family protein, partial [bacterium]|nr:oligosaccharide flippase family protein [bacterium]
MSAETIEARPPTGIARLVSALGPEKLKFSADVIYASLSQVLGRGSLIIASILVANFMATESFTAFTYFNLTLSMIATVSTLGLGVAASRIFAESAVSLDQAKRRELWTVLMLAFGSAALTVLMVHLLPREMLLAGVEFSRPMLYAAILAVTMNNVLIGALSGCGRFGTMALASVISLLALLVGVGVAAALGEVGLAIWAVLISTLLHLA